MTPSQVDELHRRICECMLEKFMALLKPWCEQVKLLLDGQSDLARRVEVLERQNRELKEDYVNVLKLLYEQGAVPANPWEKISTR
jgi:hypothetical protein